MSDKQSVGNNKSSEKEHAIKNVLWKLLERVAAQGVSFVVSIIIARILSPSDYGIVGLVTVFFAFANVLISGGLNSALIQKGDADIEDYSSVFHISMILSLIVYAVLFIFAPFISELYNQPMIIPILRVMGLVLPVNAAKSIVCAYVSSTLQFRMFFFATLGGTIVSAFVGIIMAVNGYGAWALVSQQMINSAIDTIILYCMTRLKLRLSISGDRLRPLIKYGWKVLVSSLISTIYTEIRPLVIGVKFSTTDLSYYTKGDSFPKLITQTTTNTLSAVMFPIMAKHQDDTKALLEYTRKFIRTAAFVVFPLMLGMFAVSDSFVLLLLKEKWLPAAYYIRIFSISSMFSMINIGNCEVIKAMGRSDIFLIIEIVKKVSYFLILVGFILFGETPQVLAVASLVCVAVAVIVNTMPNRRLLGYRYKDQIMDILPSLITAIIMCLLVTYAGKIHASTLLVFIIQIAVGVISYLLMSFVGKNESLHYVLYLLKGWREKKL